MAGFHKGRRRAAAFLVSIAVVIAGCGGGPPSQEGEGAAPTSGAVSEAETTTTSTLGTATTATTSRVGEVSDTAGGGECTVTIAGDWDDVWTFEQAITSFSTDYWLSEQDLRDTIEFLGEDIAGGTYEEIVGRGEPVITFLQISCSNPDDLIEGALVLATNDTSASQLPMGPGSYPISGGLFDADGPPGTVIADLSVTGDEVYGTVIESGSLEIIRWDLDGIEGSFSFTAQEVFSDDPQEVQVSVEFSFVCREWFSGC